MIALSCPHAAAHEAESRASPDASVSADGAPGSPAFSLAEGDHGPSPRAFRARTCTWYSVPFVRPRTVRDSAVESCSIATVTYAWSSAPFSSCVTQK